MFLLWLRQLPQCGDLTPASVPPPTEGRSSPTNTLVFPPGSFVLPSFVWFYIFFSTGQVLLSTLSWCSAFTSVSEGVFLIYLWREMYSTSTYSSTILFSPSLMHSCWECKPVLPLWKTVWSFLKKLKIELPYDPAISLLGIWLKKMKTLMLQDLNPYVHWNIIYNDQGMATT